jgi:predicted PurR-regulated permease PerM
MTEARHTESSHTAGEGASHAGHTASHVSGRVNRRRGPDHRGDILFAFGLAAAGYVAWMLRDVLILLYISALFAVAFRPIVRSTGHIRVGRWQPFHGKAILVLLLVAAGGLAAFGFLAIPPVLHDLEQLSARAPAKVPQILSRLQRIPFADRIDPDALTQKIQGSFGQAAGYALSSAKSWAGKVADVITGFVLTLYFILEGADAYRWLLTLLPMRRRERLDETLQRAGVRMSKWLVGQGSLMLILGGTSTVVFLCLHLRYAYALGVLTGLLNVVPVLGATVSLILALVVAALDSWQRALGVAIFFLVYLQVENSYLVPRIMRTRVDLPALAILVALLFGFALEGVAGALVAVPTAVLVAVLLDEYMVHKDDEKTAV